MLAKVKALQLRIIFASRCYRHFTIPCRSSAQGAAHRAKTTIAPGEWSWQKGLEVFAECCQGGHRPPHPPTGPVSGTTKRWQQILKSGRGRNEGPSSGETHHASSQPHRLAYISRGKGVWGYSSLQATSQTCCTSPNRSLSKEPLKIPSLGDWSPPSVCKKGLGLEPLQLWKVLRKLSLDRWRVSAHHSRGESEPGPIWVKQFHVCARTHMLHNSGRLPLQQRIPTSPRANSMGIL